VRLWIAAVGLRQPAWATAAFDDYAKRFPPELKLDLKAVKAEPRGSRSVEQMLAAEGLRLRAALPKGAHRVLLDERGERLDTRRLAARLDAWIDGGRDAAFVIGGPDGVEASLKAECNETLRLSDLTLPHALVRVLLAEALYRAWSLRAGHPYHRE
jgi:23S rRNA (pseudouridine1915-N3)-methyltransferase